MRTKTIKASSLRIGDVLYGIGTVENINHLDRDTLDIYTDSEDYADWNRVTPMDAMVEIVTHSNGKAV